MTQKDNIRRLFEKYLDNTLSKKEYRDFMKLLSDSQGETEMEELAEKLWKDTANLSKEDYNTPKIDKRLRYKGITDRVDLENETKRKNTRKSLSTTGILRIAAVFTFFALSALWLLKNDISPVSSESVFNPGAQEAVTLKLDNGHVKVIFANTERPVLNAKGKVVATQKGNRLHYKSQEATEEVVYNEISVPYANHFDIRLSDGTVVKLNAGSWLKYPTAFGNEGTREVFLKGEAYFEVAENPERPFVVNAGDINVRALGTEFNVTYYPEDNEINTVLVNGSVEIAALTSEGMDPGKATLLKPGEKGAWHKQDKALAVEPVNTELYTAWKDGILLFRKTSFNTIRLKLERQFDVTIKNRYDLLERQVYTATFRNESISEILDAFKSETPFDYDYNIATNTITLTQKQ